MAQTKIENTAIIMQDNRKVTYEKRGFLIFTWYVVVKTESMGRDLMIATSEDYDKIILNDKIIWKKK